ncbi:hypothetical protein J2D73_08485 [Acetobacter sacchari]|uniref:Uncharacterized protein n=1 Tax=Acetobacter sacchari TaxID=2661687 RepID=A0ABS3LV91_9PROT|nr:hypothetical protein [Acetobacter sacchari]MBO1359830.1 hypothetical protein [Acetobacter sacchari]
MRVLEAARLVITGKLDPEVLWQMTTPAERVAIALLLGRPDHLPPSANTPVSAWKILDARHRDLILRRAPARVAKRLPGYVAGSRPAQPVSVAQ